MRKFITGLLLIISLHSFSQQPIIATIAGGDLYSIDLTNCTRHFIGSTGQGFGDIAFTPNGQLWGIVGGQLYHIDTITANATLIGNTGVGAVSLVGLNDTTLLAEFGMKLYSINTNSATSSYIDTIGYQASGDLTWYDDDLYMVTSAGQIIRMVLNVTNTVLVSVTPIGTSVPTCEGAVTASFLGGYNSIVGFNGPDLIKICQIDGSIQMLCPNLNIDGTPGAASLRLATQIPQPTTCSTTAVPETFSKNQFSIFPNPTINQLNIKTNLNEQFRFTIYNLFGQVVKTGILQSDVTTIQTNNLSGGLYIIELNSENNYERQCFMVEK